MSFTRISEVMTGNVIDINENATIADVIDLYMEKKISGVPVRNSAGAYVGVISKTDLVTPRMLACLAAGRSLATVKVSELMNTNLPKTLKADQPLDDAIELMVSHRIHRLFVTDDTGEMVGVVSTLDIVRAARFSFEAYL